MICDDFVLLGTTVPELTRSGRILVCSAGYSAELRRLVRVYPIPWGAHMRRWDRHRLPLELNPEDNRTESYRLATDLRHKPYELARWLESCRTDTVTRSLVDLDRFIAPSIRWLNEHRRSLGIIEPRTLERRWEHDREADAALMQLPGFETNTAPTMGRRSFPKRPRIVFDDDDGHHDLAFNEWGAYEWIRKHPDNREQLWSNLHFAEPDRAVRLLVGNHNHHRNSWLVIAYLQFTSERQLTLEVAP